MLAFNSDTFAIDRGKFRGDIKPNTSGQGKGRNGRIFVKALLRTGDQLATNALAVFLVTNARPKV